MQIRKLPLANSVGTDAVVVGDTGGRTYRISMTALASAIGSVIGSGTVTQVGMTVPAFLSVTGSPILTAGTLAVSLSGTPLPSANTQITLDLANATVNSAGAALVAYNSSLTYPVGSVGSAIAAASGGGGSGSAMPNVTDAPFNASGDGTTPAQAAFVAAAAAFSQVRIPPGTYRFSATTTISTAMAMDAGATLSADAGVIVTINGRLEAGRTLHFSGAGSFIFAPGSVDNVNAEWLGLSTTGTEAANTAALQRAWVAGFGTGVTVGRGAFPLADTTLEAKALANTSQLPNFFLGVGVDGNGGGGGVSTNVGTSFFGNSARIHFLNSSATNSDAKIDVRGFHVVGPNDDSSGVGGIKVTKLSGLNLQLTQVTGSRGHGAELIDCYGVVVENNTFLSNRQHGILCNQRFNQSALRNNKCIGNGKDYTGIYANIAFAGGAGLESLGPVIENNDTSYAGSNAVLYKRSNPSPSARSITITNVVVSGGVATATTATAHGRTTGNYISLLGATVDVNLNTFFTPQITVTSSTAFTWTTTAANGTYTETTLVIGPAAYGAIYNDIRGAKITTYAEDCIGVALYMGSNSQACTLSGGYDQGFNVSGGGSGIILFDNPSNINVDALSLSGANTILRVATTTRKHGVNIESTVTVENGAQIQYGTIEMRDGQYYASAQPSTGTWKRGDWVQNLLAAPGSPQGWYCSAAPNTFVAIDAAAGGGSLPAQSAPLANRPLVTDGTNASWASSLSMANITLSGGLTSITINNTGNATVGGTLTGAVANFSSSVSVGSLSTTGTVTAGTFSTAGNATSGSLSVSGGATVGSLVVTSGGASITGAASFQCATGTTANFSPGTGGSAIRAVTAGSGTTGMTIDGSSGGTALNVIGAVRFDPGTSTGTATVGLGALTGGKPGGNTNFVWIPWNMNGTQGDILWAPR